MQGSDSKNQSSTDGGSVPDAGIQTTTNWNYNVEDAVIMNILLGRCKRNGGKN